MMTLRKANRLDPFRDPIQKGTYAGAKIPRLMLTNAGWFFWSMGQGTLVASFDRDLLQELFLKTTQIKIPPASGQVIVADYFSTPADGLTEVKLRPASEPGSALISEGVVTKCVLDLAHDYHCVRGFRAPVYDPIVNHVIDLYFGGSKGNVTEEAALQFFSTAANFASGELPQKTKTNLQLQ